jgi:hypothetical protein
MRCRKDVAACRWALVGHEALAKAARNHGLLVAPVGETRAGWVVCSLDDGSQAAWDGLRLLAGAEMEVRDASDGGFQRSWLEAAVGEHASWLLAARGMPRVEACGKHWDGCGGAWEVQVVLCGTQLHVGWKRSVAPWHALVCEEAVRSAAAIECVVGGLAARGLFVGLAECSPDVAQAVRREWEEKFNLKSRGALAKVMVRGQLVVAPIEFVLGRSAPLPPVSSSALWGMTFLNQWLQVLRMRRTHSDHSLLEMDSPQVANVPEDMMGRDEWDLDDPLPGLSQGFDPAGDDDKRTDDGRVWGEICSSGLREGRESWREVRAAVRDMVVGSYPAVEGIASSARSFGATTSWLPTIEDQSPLKQVRRRKRHKIASAEQFLMEEDPVAPKLGQAGSQHRGQWHWRLSRELLWDVKTEAGVSEWPQIEPPVVVLAGSEKVALPASAWHEFEEGPKVRAKWDTGQMVEVDESAVVLWDRLRLCPIVPAKKVSFVAVCSRGQDRGVAALMNDVSSIWTSHLLGSHTPDAGKQAVVEVTDDDGPEGEGFVAVLRRFLSDVDVANSEAPPLVAYVVWPMRLEPRELARVLGEFNEGFCARDVIVQVIPEDFVVHAARWSVQELRELSLEVFGRIRVYKMASREPPFVLAHPLLGERLSLHVAYCWSPGSRVVAAAIRDPSGEIWSCDWLREEDADSLNAAAVHAWVEEFARRNVPRIPNVRWSVALLDCSPCHFAPVIAMNGHIETVSVHRVRPNHLFPLAAEAYGVGTLGGSCFLAAGSGRSVLIENGSNTLADEVAVMLASAKGCTHIDFVRNAALLSKDTIWQ